MRTESFTPEFVDEFPTPLAAGHLYISIEFNSAAHLCACGCGEEIITPLSPAQWSFTYNGVNVSMRPSIGNWSLACRSHYVIQRGKVQWAKRFGAEDVARNRERDRRALEGAVRQHDDPSAVSATRAGAPDASASTSSGLARRLLRKLGARG